MRRTLAVLALVTLGLLIAAGMLGGVDRSVEEPYVTRKSRLAASGITLDEPQRRALMAPSFN
jgi:hypothetical protein